MRGSERKTSRVGERCLIYSFSPLCCSLPPYVGCQQLRRDDLVFAQGKERERTDLEEKKE